MEQQLISVKELCEAASIGRTYAYRLINENRVQSLRLGARRLVVLASVEALIQRLLDEQARPMDASSPQVRLGAEGGQ